jgi:hypothetical protein
MAGMGKRVWQCPDCGDEFDPDDRDEVTVVRGAVLCVMCAKAARGQSSDHATMLDWRIRRELARWETLYVSPQQLFALMRGILDILREADAACDDESGDPTAAALRAHIAEVLAVEE